MTLKYTKVSSSFWTRLRNVSNRALNTNQLKYIILLYQYFGVNIKDYKARRFVLLNPPGTVNHAYINFCCETITGKNENCSKYTYNRDPISYGFFIEFKYIRNSTVHM